MVSAFDEEGVAVELEFKSALSGADSSASLSEPSMSSKSDSEDEDSESE